MTSTKFKLSSEDWLLQERGFHPHKQGMYESLFTLGNGYLGQRGSLEENPKGSYRGTYIAGIFDKSEGFAPEIVKVPGWTDLSVWIGEEKFNFETCKIISHGRTLDMRKGVLHRKTRFKDSQGRILKVEISRLVFAHQVHGAVLDISITPENFSEELKIVSGLNGDVFNKGYFQGERVRHLSLVSMKRERDYIYLEAETRDNKIKIATASSIIFNNHPTHFIKVNRLYGEKLSEEIIFDAEKKKTYNFTKWVSVYTSREGYERQLMSTTIDTLRSLMHQGLDYHLGRHIEAREHEWERADIEIKGDTKAQKGIRFNLYHLIICKPHHDPTVSIAAKFLTGEGYKGHVFWDTELFILPFYIHTFSREARDLAMYRYYTLKGAIENARKLGYRGAKYAWESADSGIETTPSYSYLPDGTEFKIFTSDEEHHIVSDVVYALFKYYDSTEDNEFMYKYGAEIVFQTAKFWLSRVEKRRDRYEIRKVIGPDEFHEHADNNAFTNYLVMWHFSKAVELYKKMQKEAPIVLKKVSKRIRLKKAEIERMKVISKTIYFPFDQRTNLIEQFEGYFTLEDYIIEKMDKHGLPEFPEGVDEKRLSRTQLIKQADVVLLLNLFPDLFPPEVKKKNYEYYEARTMHKSSLSPCIYAMMGLEVGGHKKAYNYFMKTSYLDLFDAHRNTAAGIHAAATGGAWMTVVHGFAGMRVRRGILSFDPWLPERWQGLNYRTEWKNNVLSVRITHRDLVLKVISSHSRKSIDIHVQGKTLKLHPDEELRVELKKKY